jgi:hypothetical protein
VAEESETTETTETIEESSEREELPTEFAETGTPEETEDIIKIIVR